MISVVRPPVIAAAVLLWGCVTPPPNLYSWGSYQDEVYAYLQAPDGNIDEQLAKLEESRDKAKAKDAQLPPGFHAHLGLLYAKLGRLDQAAIEFNAEKAQYPESAAYMDFLLRDKSKKVAE